MKDTQFLPEKLSNKMAKELFERFQEYERIYQKVFSGALAVYVVSSWLANILTFIQSLLH